MHNEQIKRNTEKKVLAVKSVCDVEETYLRFKLEKTQIGTKNKRKVINGTPISISRSILRIIISNFEKILPTFSFF